MVWIPKVAGHNYDNATQYGELAVIVPEDVSPFNLDMVETIVKAKMSEVMPKDFYVPVGPPIINMLVMKHWPYPVMRVLMFHARSKDYILRDVIT